MTVHGHCSNVEKTLVTSISIYGPSFFTLKPFFLSRSLQSFIYFVWFIRPWTGTSSEQKGGTASNERVSVKSEKSNKVAGEDSLVENNAPHAKLLSRSISFDDSEDSPREGDYTKGGPPPFLSMSSLSRLDAADRRGSPMQEVSDGASKMKSKWIISLVMKTE